MKISTFTLSLFLAIVFIFSSTIYSGWSRQTSSTTYDLYAISMANNMTGWATGNLSPIIHTTNGGASWVQQLSPSNGVLNCIWAIDGNTAVAVGKTDIGASRLTRTTNGGVLWYAIPSPATWELRAVQFINSSTGYIISIAGELLETTNGGASWNMINQQIFYITPVYNVSFVNSSTGFVSIWAGTECRTINGGLNWVYNIVDSLESPTLFNIKFVNPQNGWVAGDMGALYYTTNGGNKWIKPSGVGDSNTFYGLYTLSTNLVYTVGSGGTILATSNAGQNWYRQASGTAYNLYTIQMITQNEGWISGADGVILHTTDGGGPIGIKNISSNVPKKYSLSQNYPNPFNPSTQIKFEIPKTANVMIVVYDMLGHKVDIILDQKLNPGTYETEWDGTRFSSGVYFYRLVTDNFSLTKKMSLVK